ncbi:MAG: type II toxin-antitoxin system HipA family toxin [Steroidobacterales bacterium]
MSRRFDTVSVYVDLEQFKEPALMGTLRRQGGAAKDIFSFEYDEAWLKRPEAFAFDPDLALHVGPQYPPADRGNFGMFLDSAPDRWGRALMQRRENVRARKEERKPRPLTEWDYLLGVSDETRVGALRFRAGAEGVFLDSENRMAAPPITSLRELQSVSLQIERHIDDERNPEYERWLSQLVAPGTSLGGARPKASIRDEDGVLCIAKFPSNQDTRDIGAWELVAHRLAERAGIDVPQTRAIRMGESPYTTFLARRFDRTPNQGRLAFVSAMTLTQRVDGEPGASYLELVDLLQSRGADTQRDCVEMFRRVVFNILIHNTDDHLRNHGFFIGAHGITLSPVFDINPSIDRTDLTLAINEIETACDVKIAMEACGDYGLSSAEAKSILEQVSGSVAGWRKAASALKIPRSEQDLMAPAFE